MVGGRVVGADAEQIQAAITDADCVALVRGLQAKVGCVGGREGARLNTWVCNAAARGSATGTAGSALEADSGAVDPLPQVCL